MAFLEFLFEIFSNFLSSPAWDTEINVLSSVLTSRFMEKFQKDLAFIHLPSLSRVQGKLGDLQHLLQTRTAEVLGKAAASTERLNELPVVTCHFQVHWEKGVI